MKIVVTLSLLLLACALAEARHKCHQEPSDDPDSDYEKFQKCIDPSYKRDHKHKDRVKHFKKCHHHVKNHDAEKTGYSVGLNHFCQWTEDEFNDTLNHEIDAKDLPIGPAAPTFYSRQDMSGNWSWVDKGAVSPVKNQGQCGSCYTFAAAAVLEGAYFIKTGQLYNLSTQQYVDCSNGYGITYVNTLVCNGSKCYYVTTPEINSTLNKNKGCNGGAYTVAWLFTQQVQTLMTWECYPYTSGDTKTSGTCMNPSCQVSVNTSSFVVLPSNNETALQYAVRYIGPVACAINATSIKTYSGGVISTQTNGTNHAVTVVGYGTTPSGVDVWIVKNSWGTGWGDHGYFYLQRGVNALNIAYYCAYPTPA